MSEDWKFWAFLLTIAFNAGAIYMSNRAAIGKIDVLTGKLDEYIRFNDRRAGLMEREITHIGTSLADHKGQTQCPGGHSGP